MLAAVHASHVQLRSSNAPAETTEEYYKRNCAIPFLDYIIANLDSRFSPLALKATSLLCLLPSIVCTKEVDLKEVLELYETDFPSPELAQLELTRWKAKYQCLRPGQRPDMLAASIKDCDPDSFANLHILLQIACTLPVTSCECERNASALRRLRNYMRATMECDWQANLALIPHSL